MVQQSNPQTGSLVLRPELAAGLDALAALRGRPAVELAQEAVSAYLQQQVWQDERIAEALDELARDVPTRDVDEVFAGLNARLEARIAEGGGGR